MQGLRKQLREATREAHESLDAAMQVLDLHSATGFARFLGVQHAARAPIEAWCVRHCDPDMLPPAQSSLIERDLAQLGIEPRADLANFAPPAFTDPLGVVWTLAGSALGNRMILAELEKQYDTDQPRAFLSDPAMFAFWKGMKPRFEAPVSQSEASHAIAGSLAVFATFHAALALHDRQLAA